MADGHTSDDLTQVPRHRWFENGRIWMIVAVAATSCYVFFHLQTGWVPWDEGQLAQSAERVLYGEVPHRDFDEMYTGGLTYLNAAAFKMFGVRCESTRYMLWLFFVPFCCAVFWLTSRAIPAWSAALVTFTTGAISLPVYTAALPSWYNLFFLTFGLVAGFKFIDSGNRWWLLLAGLFAGISVLFKVTGLFWLAAAILFVVYYEQTKPSPHHSRSIGFDIFVGGCLALFAFSGLKFCGLLESASHGRGLTFVHLGLPLILVSLFLASGQLRSDKGGFGFRMKRLLKYQIPLLIGAAIPIVAWIALYYSFGALDSLYEGVFVLPLARITSASHAFPGWMHLVVAIPFVALTAVGFSNREFFKRHSQVLAYCGCGIVVAGWIAACRDVFYWQLAFHAFRNCLPMIVVISLGYLLLARKADSNDERRLELFLLTAAVVTGGLIQYPFSIDIYFFYIAPVVLIVIAHLLRSQLAWTKAIHVALLAGFALTAVFKMSTVFPANNTIGIANPNGAGKLGLTRCSMVVPDFDVEVYRELVETIDRLSKPSDTIFAGPDCPEVYFLANRQNPTRIMYDFFRPEVVSKPDELFKQLQKQNVRLVVLRREVAFSKLNRALEVEAGQYFTKRKNIYRRDPCNSNRRKLAFTVLFNK